MENLTTEKLSITPGNGFTGRYIKTTDTGHVFSSRDNSQFEVEHHKHTDLAVSKIAPGAVCLFEKTDNGYDVFKLEPIEVEAWLKPPMTTTP